MKNWPFSTISRYFENVTRYSQSCNGRKIGTRMRSIKRCHFHWPSMTPNVYFKVTIFWTSNNSKMVRDRAIYSYNGRPIYKVVYMVYQSVPFSMNLSDTYNPYFKFSRSRYTYFGLQRITSKTLHTPYSIWMTLNSLDEWLSIFLSRVSILTRNIDIANLSVRLFFRPSVTFRYQMKTA